MVGEGQRAGGRGGIPKGEQWGEGWGEGWAVAANVLKRMEVGRGQGFLFLSLAFFCLFY